MNNNEYDILCDNLNNIIIEKQQKLDELIKIVNDLETNLIILRLKKQEYIEETNKLLNDKLLVEKSSNLKNNFKKINLLKYRK